MTKLFASFVLTFTLFFGVSSAQEKDTIKIHLSTIDTTFFMYGKVHGKIYHFQQAADSVYLSLSFRISTWDMGQANCYPTFNFKQTDTSAIYLIYVNGSAYQRITFRNEKFYEECWLPANTCYTMPVQRNAPMKKHSSDD